MLFGGGGGVQDKGIHGQWTVECESVSIGHEL